MSKVIEEQIVKMQFDNKGFESGVQQSMSTLDKLKAALHFKDVNMTPLEKAFSQAESTATRAGFHIRDVWLKMSEVFEYQIARKIVNAGEKIAKSLTIEGATDGFREYELKMGSIQTIMAGTGESLATVNQYLEELNTYSDQTIYSFKDMTDSIGKFTNAGVELSMAVDAIKGIANEAAVSGANANEASRAMYNFSQALSAGYVKLIDWKSIENANMATVEFKNTLLEVADGLGTVKKNIDGTYDSITANAQGKISEAFNATQNFNDSLQSQWMNTEVLTKALKIYATNVEDLTPSQKELYEAELRSMNLNDEQIQKFEELGVKAAKAATEIKTFSMLIDTVKEGIGSGWAMSFEYLIGDFEEAKELWTDVGNVVGDIVNKISDGRNKVLKEGLASGWKQLTMAGDSAIPAVESFREQLTKAAIAQGTLTVEEAKNLDTTSKWIKVFKEKGLMTTKFLEDNINKYYDFLSTLDEDSRKAIGVDDMDIAKFKDFTKAIEDGEVNLQELVKGFYELGGRENIIQGLKNIFGQISEVLGKIGEAWNHVFKPITGDTVKGLTERFREFTEGLEIHEEALESVKTTATVLFQVLRTGFNIVSSVFKGIAKLILPVYNLIDAVIGVFGQLISAITGSDGIVDFTDKMAAGADKLRTGYLNVMQWIADKINEIAEALRNWKESTAFKTLSKWVTDAKQKLSDFWEEFKNLSAVQQIMQDFENLSNRVSDAFERLGSNVGDFFDKFKSKFTLENFNNILTKIYNGLKNFGTAIKNAKTSVVNFFKEIKSGTSITQAFKNNFKGLIDGFKEIKKTISDFFEKIFGGGDASKFKELSDAIHDFFTSLDADKVTAIALTTVFGLFAINLLRLTNAVSDTVAAIGSTFTTLKNVINSYMKRQKSVLLQIAEAIVIVAAALYVLSTIPADQMKTALTALYAISGCIAVLLLITATVTKIANAGLDDKKKISKLSEMTFSLIGLAGTIVMATFALKKINEIKIDKGIIGKLALVVGVIGSLGLITAAMGKIKVAKEANFVKTTVTLLAVAASMLIIAKAMEKINAIASNPDQFEDLTNGMLKMMAGLAVVAMAAGSIGGFSALGILAVVVLFEKIMPRVEAIINYDYTKINAGLEKNKEVIEKIGAMMGVMIVVGGLFGKGFSKMGTGLIKLMAVMAILVLLAKKASELDELSIDRGTLFMKSLTNMVTQLIVCMGIYNMMSKLDKGQKGGLGMGTFLGIILMLGAMTLIAKKAGTLEDSQMKKGLKFIAILTLLVDAMFVVAGIAGSGNSASFKNLALILAGVSFILGLMVTLSLIKDKNSLYASMAAIVVVLLSLAAVFAAVSKVNSESKKTDKGSLKKGTSSGGILATLAGVAAIIGGMVWLSKQPVNNIAAAAAGITIAMLAYTKVFAAVQKNYGVASVSNKKRIATILSGLAAVAVIAVAIAWLSNKGGDAKNMASAAAGITIGILGLSVCLKALGKIGGTAKKYTKLWHTVGAAIAVLAAVSLAIGLLSNLGGDPKNMIAAAGAITIGMVGIAICMSAIAFASEKVKDSGTSAGIIVGAIASMAVVAIAIGALSQLNVDPDSSIKYAVALGIGALAIGVVAILLGTASTIAKKAKVGTVATIIGGAIVAMIAVGAAMIALGKWMDPESLQTVIDIAPTFAALMGSFGVMCIALAEAAEIMSKAGKTGFVAGLAAIGLGVVALILLVGIMIGLGAILNGFEGRAKENLETGLDAFVEICGKVGTAFGDLIGNFLDAINETVILGLGDTLNTVMDDDHLGGFFKKVEGVSQKAIDGAKNIAAVVAAWIGVSWLDFIANVATFGQADNGPSMDFEAIGKAVVAFSNSVKDLTEDDLNKANLAAQIALSLSQFADNMPRHGWWEKIVGEKEDVGTFGTQMVGLARGVLATAAVAKSIKDEDVTNIQRLVKAIEPINTFAQSLENTGGLLGRLVGDDDLGTFSETLNPFITNLVKFLEKAKELEGYPHYATTIMEVKMAVEPLNEFANSLENTGGVLAGIVGDNNLKTFSNTFVPFVTNLISFLEKAKELDEYPDFATKIKNVTDSTTPLSELARQLKSEKTNFMGFGQLDLNEFGRQIKVYANKVADAAEALAELEVVNLNKLIMTIEPVKKFAELGADENLTKDNMKNIVDSVDQLAKLDLTALSKSYEDNGIVIDSLETLLTEITTTIKDNTDSTVQSFEDLGKSNISSMATTMTQTSKTTLIPALSDIVKSIISNLNTLLSKDKFKPYGSYISEGLAEGIEEGEENFIKPKIKKVTDNIKNRTAAGLEEKSPSKASYRFGLFWDKGLGNGIEDGAEDVNKSTDILCSAVLTSLESYNSKVYNKAEELSDSTTSSINNGLNNSIRKIFDMNDDFTPVIRPKLDLSNVTNSARKIGGLFGSQSIGVNASGQNGTMGGNGTVVFNQYNNSPKALSRIDIYRNTSNQLAMARMRGALT